MLGAIIVLIGAVLLIAAAFVPWYTQQIKASVATYNITINQNAYPGIPSSNGTIQYTCSGLPSGFNCFSQTSYKNLNLNNTGNIAEAGYFMMIVGFILGLVGAIAGFMSRSNPRRAGMAIALAIVAMILAVAAVGLFAALLPGAIGNDTPGHSGTGPWSSFWGSGNGTLYGFSGASWTWGPGIGWYLALVGFVILLIGVIILFMGRKDVEPMPETTPEPSAAPSGAPPATPPPSS
jgi:hypothetical protein